MDLPEFFIKSMHQQLGAGVDEFLRALQSDAPVSLHLHPQKPCDFRSLADSVPWHPELGRYLDERPVFTLDPAFHGGAYYVQEASSMLVSEILKQKTDLKQPLRILDLCAAPGGKSTLIASLLNEQSWILANEVIQNRYQVLGQNITKWGLPNMLVSNHDPEDFGGLKGFFDVVLVDAPCSGEGLFRKDPHALAEWSANNVDLCMGRQKRILSAAIPLIKKGGLLIYSTCTYNDHENVDNCRWMLQNFKLEEEKIALETGWGIIEKSHGIQCYPHLVRGEGFFTATFRQLDGPVEKFVGSKEFFAATPLPKSQVNILEPWLNDARKYRFAQFGKDRIRAIPNAIMGDVLVLDKYLRKKRFGIEIGALKGTQLVPEHALALSTILNASIPAIDLPREAALRYLKRESPDISLDAHGWHLARYHGVNLGWMKLMPNRINNYLPVHWRIRMDI